MRNYPEANDTDDVDRYKVPQWMLDTLKYNPDYTSWGNYEDYMTGGYMWNKATTIPSVSGLIELNELNEMINFYFLIDLNGTICAECDGYGYKTRLGVHGSCEVCAGHGDIVLGDPRLQLQMWIIHPRKGASRGIILENIQENEITTVVTYLRGAQERNNSRWAKLPHSKPQAH